MVVLKTATWMRIAETTRARRRCNSKARSSRNEVILPARPGRGCKSSVLSAFRLELAHEGDQLVDPVLGERVVDRRSHPANRPVALEAVEAGGGRLLDEGLLQIFG